LLVGRLFDRVLLFQLVKILTHGALHLGGFG